MGPLTPLVTLRQRPAFQIYTTATSQFPLTLHASVNSINSYVNAIPNCVKIDLLLGGIG